jgi:hypothetical protein
MAECNGTNSVAIFVLQKRFGFKRVQGGNIEYTAVLQDPGEIFIADVVGQCVRVGWNGTLMADWGYRRVVSIDAGSGDTMGFPELALGGSFKVVLEKPKV